MQTPDRSHTDTMPPDTVPPPDGHRTPRQVNFNNEDIPDGTYSHLPPATPRERSTPTRLDFDTLEYTVPFDMDINGDEPLGVEDTVGYEPPMEMNDPGPPVTPAPSGRPRRTTRAPKHLADYVRD